MSKSECIRPRKSHPVLYSYYDQAKYQTHGSRSDTDHCKMIPVTYSTEENREQDYTQEHYGKECGNLAVVEY